jgi:AcrR family transcriptional regulator
MAAIVCYRTFSQNCMEKRMDRRQRKTREAIFKAFIGLLAKKDFNQITVGEIIERADVGRATFYAHFETKDFLLKELCEDLFCHIFDALEEGGGHHKHIFECDTTAPVILHLLLHLQKNDNHLLELLGGENNELFLRYFKENLRGLIEKQSGLFADKKPEIVSDDFWIHHMIATLVDTIRWWIDGGLQETAETVYAYFLAVV